MSRKGAELTGLLVAVGILAWWYMSPPARPVPEGDVVVDWEVLP